VPLIGLAAAAAQVGVLAAQEGMALLVRLLPEVLEVQLVRQGRVETEPGLLRNLRVYTAAAVAVVVFCREQVGQEQTLST
jgi:hypothetical protein